MTPLANPYRPWLGMPPGRHLELFRAWLLARPDLDALLARADAAALAPDAAAVVRQVRAERETVAEVRT